MSIGTNIRTRRIQLDMSQKDLASAIGISVPMICQIERGTKSVTLQLGADIARVLGCGMEDFLEEK